MASIAYGVFLARVSTDFIEQRALRVHRATILLTNDHEHCEKLKEMKASGNGADFRTLRTILLLSRNEI